MNQSKARILFLFSDTGGGHRSSCEAIMEAIQSEYGAKVEMEMIDFLQDYYPWPYRKIPAIYRWLGKLPRLYGKFWHFTNTPGRAKKIMDINRFNAQLRQAHAAMLAEHPADLVVSTHFMSIPPTLWMDEAQRAETVVVVTDLVSTHATWYRNDIDHYIVPTEAALDSAIQNGIDPLKIDLLGLPVSNRFIQHENSKIGLRSQLGWDLAKPVVLLIGGGEGMGPLEEHAYAIAQAGVDLELAIITGRNKKMKARLEGQDWPVKLHVYGFERNMQNYMQAADVLVTKAGPSTICEGLVSALPIILYDRLPGQEEGNVTYLVENQAGTYAPEPQQVVATLKCWLADPDALQQMQVNALGLANPDAATHIARYLAELLDIEPSGTPIDAKFEHEYLYL